MRIKIKGKEITLHQAEVKSAKKAVAKFLKNMQKASEKHRLPTYYLTLLVVMHLMSQEALDNMDPDVLQKIMDTFNREKTD